MTQDEKYEDIFDRELTLGVHFSDADIVGNFGVKATDYREWKAEKCRQALYAKNGINPNGSDSEAKKNTAITTPQASFHINHTDNTTNEGGLQATESTDVQNIEDKLFHYDVATTTAAITAPVMPVTNSNDGNAYSPAESDSTRATADVDASVTANDNLTFDERVQKAVAFLQTYFKNCHGYAYVWILNKQHKRKMTFYFNVESVAELTAAVKRGMTLNQKDFYDAYFGVNIGSCTKSERERHKDEDISEQVGVVVDIDVRNPAHHKGDVKKYPPNIDTAMNFLPIKPTFLISSGGGLHAYYRYHEPLVLDSEDDRNNAVSRNKAFLDVIRKHAGNYAKSIDGVHDLPRVLRLPYSYNCKDRADLKLCYVIDDTGNFFTPAQIDEIISASKAENQPLNFDDNSRVDADISVKSVKPVTPAAKVQSVSTDDLPPEYQSARISAMLDCIPPADLSDTDWLAVLSACKNLGVDYATIDRWNAQDAARYNEKENKARYDSLNDTSFDIEVLAGKARDYGYSEKDFRRQWFKDNPSYSKNFISANTADSATTKSSLPNCPVDLQLPNGYHIDKHGIWRDKKTKEKIVTELLSPSPMVITRRLIDAEIKEETLEISWYDSNTDKWIGDIFASAADIANATTCSKLSGRGLSIPLSKSKYISEYLIEMVNLAFNRPKIPVQRIYESPGWLDSDYTTFLYPAVDDNAENLLKNNNQDYQLKFVTRGDFDTWKEKIIKLFAQNSPIFNLVFGTVLAAPLIKMLGVRNQQLHLWCNTGSGKSAVVKAAMSVFGAPEMLKHTFNGTLNALDSLSIFYNDLAVWIDEFQAADKNARESIDKFVYGFAERKTRSRCQRSGALKPSKVFCGTRITTGEQPILSDNSNAGVYNRLLQISESKIFDDDIDAREIHNFFDANYGHFGKVWIDYISRHNEEISTQFKENQRIFQRVADHEQLMNNWADYFSVTLTALQFAMSLIGKFSAQDVFKNFVPSLKLIIRDIPRKDSAFNWQRALDGLQDYISAHPRNFQYEIQHKEGISTYLGYPSGMLAGNVVHGAILRDGTVAFYPAELRKVLETELKFPSAKSIIRELADNRVLELPSQESPKHPYQKSVRLPGIGGGKWLYLFKAGTLVDKRFLSSDEGEDNDSDVVD